MICSGSTWTRRCSSRLAFERGGEALLLKNITYPTDSKLMYRAIQKLVKAAPSRGMVLRPSYLRVGKIAAVKVSRYAHAGQFKRMQRSLRKLRTLRATEEGARRPPLRGGTTGRLIRDIRRKAANVDEALSTLLSRADRVGQQQPQDANKRYSLHQPQVRCISKGKAHQR